MPVPVHPFAVTIAKARDKKRGVASLDDLELREWYADVYAFRLVVLGVDPKEASPCDPEGMWRNNFMIDSCEQYYRARRAPAEAARRSRDVEAQREGKDLLNRWAQEEGFTDIDALVVERYGERGYGDAAHAYLLSPRCARLIAEERQRRGLIDHRLNGAAP